MSDSGDAKPERAPRVRAEGVPVPKEFVGQTKTGLISDVLKTRLGSGQFGFILVGGDVSKENAPRIYFNFTDFTDSEFRARKGYAVSFTVTEDENSRFAAKNVVLTAAGKVTAAEREKEMAERAAVSPVPAGKKGKPRRGRAPRETDQRTVNLNVTNSAAAGQKTIEAKVGDSLGKLKHLCISAFESEDITLQVYHADGRLLTKEILTAMQDGDSVHLAPKKEEN